MSWRGYLPDLGALRRRRGLGLLTLGDLSARRAPLAAAIRARCHSIPIDETTQLCRVLGRYKMFVDSRDLGLAPHLMLDGYWELWTTRFIARRLRPGMVAWDVGANLGYFSVLMADAVGATGRVLAFEPNPRLALLAARNLALNGLAARSEVRRAAVTDRAGGVLRFRADLADPKNGRLLGLDAAEAGEEDEVLEVAVPATRLDDVPAERVDLVKIDVEGAEEAVWAGMSGVLDRNPGITVLLEFNAGRSADPRAFAGEIARRFPLRELRLDGRVVAVEAAAMLDRGQDTMLVLTRGAA
jgi:FkbM family methyltransferase